MFAPPDDEVRDALIARRVITPLQAEAARRRVSSGAASFVDALLETGALPRERLFREIAAYCGCDYVGEPPALPAAAVRAALPESLARRYRVVPFGIAGETLDVLTADPFRFEIADELTFALGREVRLVGADPARLAPLLAPTADEETAAAAAGELDAIPADERALSAADLAALAARAPVVRLVERILEDAVRVRASDLHFEPFEETFSIRRRVDGVLSEIASPARQLALPCIARLKVIANLDIAERRLPQDGRIRLAVAGRTVDLRVSTLPTQFGESVVLRVLDPSRGHADLAQLGLPEHVREGLRAMIARPDGLFLVTGPTGSGKTTTLYGALRAVNDAGLKLLTIEDPVEYELEGVMQVPVNPGAGLTFAAGLRAFLRQDPDVMMVGEIRDLETAQIAVQAALTGHQVFSTLHTADAAGAVARLVDLGVEPFLLAASLQAVLAQRLLRRICPSCREAAAVPPELLDECAREPGALGDRAFFQGRGCPECRQTGYRGRLAIFEWLAVTEELRERISRRSPAAELRAAAKAGGMQSLREAALHAASEGLTTLEEVLRHT